jgi:hypothetical protein
MAIKTVGYSHTRFNIITSIITTLNILNC